MGRKFIDCREYPSEMNCTVALSADSDEELLEAAVQHAVQVTITRTPRNCVSKSRQCSRRALRPEKRRAALSLRSCKPPLIAWRSSAAARDQDGFKKFAHG
jgi:hypothetical protein